MKPDVADSGEAGSASVRPGQHSQRELGETRIGVLVGDRLCARCCFNLTGQTIVREPIYGMLVARCPECGTLAAIQEYPLLGRWANRITYVVGAAWVFSLLAFLTINVIVITSFAVSVGTSLTFKFATAIQKDSVAYHEASLPPDPATTSRYGSWPGYLDPEWWRTRDKWQMFNDAGGWAGVIEWSALRELVLVCLFACLFGGVWAVALPHLRSWRKYISLVAVLAVTLVALVLGNWLSSAGRWGYLTPTDAAYEFLAWYLHWATLVPWAIAFAFGLWVGRATTRRVILWFLPPRLRGPWSFLWLADGKSLPRG